MLQECESRFQFWDAVGIDCEWRPSLGRFRKSKISLFQLASEDCVYLIDLLNLDDQEVSRFMLKLFGSQDIIKIGYQFDTDIKQISRTYPEMNGKLDLVNYVELLEMDATVTSYFLNQDPKIGIN